MRILNSSSKVKEGGFIIAVINCTIGSTTSVSQGQKLRISKVVEHTQGDLAHYITKPSGDMQRVYFGVLPYRFRYMYKNEVKLCDM